MTCHEARELFSARVDDALTVDERAGLETHLAGCPDCRRELVRFEGTVGLLRAAPPIRAPAGFVDRVLAAAGPVPWYRRLGRRLFWPLEVKLPLEAAALVLVAVGAVYLYERSPELGQLTARKETDASRALEPSGGAPQSAPSAPLATRAPVERPPAPTTPPAKDELRASVPPRSAAQPEARQTTPAAPPPPPAQPGRAETPAPSAAEPQAALSGGPAETREYAPEGPRRDAAEEKTATGAVQDRRRLAASKAAALTARSGRLAVADRTAAEHALAELLARVEATELARRAEGREVVVELVVPGTAYRELVEGLARIGRWQPDPAAAEPSEAPVRLTLRIAD